MLLEQLLNAVKDATSVSPEAFQTDTVGDRAITYQFYRASDNGAVAQWRLQLRFFGTSMRDVMSLESLATDALVTAGDGTNFDCSISSNGGGAMLDTDTNTPQSIVYYDVICKH